MPGKVRVSRRSFIRGAGASIVVSRSAAAAIHRAQVIDIVMPGSGEGYPPGNGGPPPSCTDVSCLQTIDGQNFYTPAGVTNPIISDLQMSNGSGGTKSVGDCEGVSVLRYFDQHVMAYDQVGN